MQISASLSLTNTIFDGICIPSVRTLQCGQLLHPSELHDLPADRFQRIGYFGIGTFIVHKDSTRAIDRGSDDRFCRDQVPRAQSLSGVARLPLRQEVKSSPRQTASSSCRRDWGGAHSASRVGFSAGVEERSPRRGDASDEPRAWTCRAQPVGRARRSTPVRRKQLRRPPRPPVALRAPRP